MCMPYLVYTSVCLDFYDAFLFFIYLFDSKVFKFYLLKKQSHRETGSGRKRDLHYNTLVHPLNGHNSWDRARLALEANSQVRSRDSSTCAILYCFPSYSGFRSGAARPGTRYHIGCLCCNAIVYIRSAGNS